MKTVYVCEKCGANYDNYDAAYNCENRHADIAISSEYNTELRNRSVWKNGERLPRTCILPTLEIYDKDPDTGEYRYVTLFGIYELKRALKAEEVDKIKEESSIRREKEEADYKRWQEEYRKQKEAKAAAEAAAAESEASDASASEDNVKESA